MKKHRQHIEQVMTDNVIVDIKITLGEDIFDIWEWDHSRIEVQKFMKTFDQLLPLEIDEIVLFGHNGFMEVVRND